VHGGLVDPAAIGRKGGKVSKLTKLRRAVGKDDELREAARETLAKALRGEPVDKPQLDAARSLFSYRADQPPREPGAAGSAGPPKIVTLRSVLEVAVECGVVEVEGGGTLLVDGHRLEIPAGSPRQKKSAALDHGGPLLLARPTNPGAA
jgi:hypothetical protein